MIRMAMETGVVQVVKDHQCHIAIHLKNRKVDVIKACSYKRCKCRPRRKAQQNENKNIKDELNWRRCQGREIIFFCNLSTLRGAMSHKMM